MARKKHVLLVDDDVTVRQSLHQALMLENFNVRQAANGQEALREFHEHRIDVVLLDINLGEESGWETFHQLRQIQPHLPVIMMTGNPAHAVPPPRHTVEALMEKPLDLIILFKRLNELVSVE